MNLPKLKPIGQPQPIWRVGQLELDLRHVCPLTGVAMTATKQTGKALYWYESGVVIDPKNEGWQRYVRGRYVTDLEAGRHRS